MNFVFIITDTQNKDMVGAYGNRAVDTPNLDKLAHAGIRFENAYTACPVCTPARGAIFSGLHPQVNGAWCNNTAPSRSIALMGEIFRHFGYRVGYTGKWHLDGTAYFGDGVAGGGFEPDWWYDGKRFAEELGETKFAAYRKIKEPEEIRKHGFALSDMWAHKVADRAIDFLNRVREEPFVLVASFDEPHQPYFAPPEYWEKFSGAELVRRPNFNAPLNGKPELVRIQREQNGEVSWEAFSRSDAVRQWYGCNSYVDSEIGRILDAIEETHGEDTTVVYTADHGDQARSHGLNSKGPMMYQETTNIPFLVRLPQGATGEVRREVVSHVDILPTMLDLAGIERPEILHGTTLSPLLSKSGLHGRPNALVSFHRFAINHDSFGEFYPIRCAVGDGFKLIINLLDTDELYSLADDPYEMTNLITEPLFSTERNALHDWLLAEMDRIRDPFRSWRWGSRSWREVRKPSYWSLPRRDRPTGFPFQAASIDG